MYSMAILKVSNLHKSFKKGFIPKTVKVLKGIEFSVESHSITGFLGGNGAGKTTTMKCILGLNFADEGEVSFFDNQYLNNEVRSKVGFLPEHPYFYDYLTGLEFLVFYGQISTKMKKKDLKIRAEELLKRVDLWHASKRKLRDYSKGMKQKLGLAQALIHEPELVILDEPMSGLDPDGRYYISEIIKDTAKKGTAVFFSSHLLPDVERLCENLVILKEGRISFEGSMEGFLNQIPQKICVDYMALGEKSTIEFRSQEELDQFLSESKGNGVQVLEIDRKRNLEDAFMQFGMEGRKTL